MTVSMAKRSVAAPGRGGIPMNPEDEEEEGEEDHLRFPGSGNPILVRRVVFRN